MTIRRTDNIWIDKNNFHNFYNLKKGQQLLTSETEDIKVAYNDLTASQKKLLPDIDRDFKVYVSSGRVSPKLKGKIVKEPYYEKSDIVSLIKLIIKEPERRKVVSAILTTDIPPVVIQQWLFQGAFTGTDKAWYTVVLAEGYTSMLETYAYIISHEDMLGCKFKFPKKLRGDNK